MQDDKGHLWMTLLKFLTPTDPNKIIPAKTKTVITQEAQAFYEVGDIVKAVDDSYLTIVRRQGSNVAYPPRSKGIAKRVVRILMLDLKIPALEYGGKEQCTDAHDNPIFLDTMIEDGDGDVWFTLLSCLKP